MCAEKAQDGDAGELFAAVSVCCRHKDAKLFAEMWRQLDVTDAQRVRAVTGAIRFEFPEDWAAASAQVMARADAGRLSLLSVALAHRRLPIGPQIAARLEAEGLAVETHVIRILGLLQDEAVLPLLGPSCRRAEADVRSSALRALVLSATSGPWSRATCPPKWKIGRTWRWAWPVTVGGGHSSPRGRVGPRLAVATVLALGLPR